MFDNKAYAIKEMSVKYKLSDLKNDLAEEHKL